MVILLGQNKLTDVVLNIYRISLIRIPLLVLDKTHHHIVLSGNFEHVQS